MKRVGNRATCCLEPGSPIFAQIPMQECYFFQIGKATANLEIAGAANGEDFLADKPFDIEAGPITAAIPDCDVDFIFVKVGELARRSDTYLGTGANIEEARDSGRKPSARQA